MATIRTLLYGFVVLVIAHQIAGQQAPGLQFPSFSGSFGGIQIPGLPGLGGGNSSSSSGFFGFPFVIPGLSGFSGLFPSLGASGSNGSASRSRRDAESQDDVAADVQSRLFFSAFPTITTCNYTTQAGVSCPSCSQALRCLPNNVGILTNCRGFFRNCNNGRCSIYQSAACANSTSG